MRHEDRRHITAALLERHGITYADELDIDIAQNSPAPLFQLLCAALLYSARISTANATRAIRALFDAGLTTPSKMAKASWQDRVDVLTTHGYKRYDESSASMLGEAAERVLTRYDGDLRKLRHAALHDVGRERELLMEFKGIGPVGADIFLREVQGVWDEVYPYADDRVLSAAHRLDLGRHARDLAALTSRARFPALVAALVRVDLADAFDEVRVRRRAS